jgi:putative membrane protein
MFIAAAQTINTDPWRFQSHLEIWLLVGFLVGAYLYMVRVVGPRVVTDGPIVTAGQRRAFVIMIVLLWLSSDWPMHDLAEEYLYSVHMLQHMILSYFVPPLALLATPEWFFRLLIGEGRVKNAARFLSRPVTAAVLYNAVLMVTHIPALVNRSAQGGPLHYSLHVVLVFSAILLWMPLCSPRKDWRISYGGQMVYLFAMSILPTIPAGWLTFAEGSVYNHYDHIVRVGGVSVISDQQAAGAIMKLGGSVFMWAVLIFVYFKRFSRGFHEQQHDSYVAKDDTLTFEEVADAFEKNPPVEEPQR